MIFSSSALNDSVAVPIGVPITSFFWSPYPLVPSTINSQNVPVLMLCVGLLHTLPDDFKTVLEDYFEDFEITIVEVEIND